MFDDAFPKIVDELVTEDAKNTELVDAAELLRECLNYNAFDGKKSRGKMVITALHFLRDGRPSGDDIQKAVMLGWCVEILQAFLLVADDIMDKSDMRRGKPCWYKKVGCTAINDTYLLEQCVYKIIDKHFVDESCIIDIYRAFHHITYLTGMGQELDIFISDNPREQFSLDSYTMDRYKAIVKYKTAYYTFYFPVYLAIILAGMNEPALLRDIETVLLKLGEFFQVQDDYLDCYGDPSVTGKVGRDIEDCKCSWLVVTALENATEEDLSVLKENYGKDDMLSVRNVKELYAKLEIKKRYLAYEEESYEDFCKLVMAQGERFPKQFMLYLAEKIYKRQK